MKFTNSALGLMCLVSLGSSMNLALAEEGGVQATEAFKARLFGTTDENSIASPCFQAMAKDRLAVNRRTFDVEYESSKIVYAASGLFCREMAIIYKLDFYTDAENRTLCAAGEIEKQVANIKARAATFLVSYSTYTEDMNSANSYLRFALQFRSQACNSTPVQGAQEEAQPLSNDAR